MKKNVKFIVAGVVILATFIWVLDAFKSSLTQYVSINEAMASDKRVQVAGLIIQGSANFDVHSNRFSFDIKEENGTGMKILYKGTKPGNFDDADKVVATGKFDRARNLFECEELLVKCPTKYEGRIKG